MRELRDEKENFLTCWVTQKLKKGFFPRDYSLIVAATGGGSGGGS